MDIIESPSPNFGPRKDGKTPRLLVIHYTDTLTLEETLALLQGEREASAHYVVDTDGKILRLVAEDQRAWHAGVSSWEGETDVNSISIGIEVQNPGHHYGLAPYPDAQVIPLTLLCQEIMERHGIMAHHVLGHSDVAAARKERPDPGHLFPWRRLAQVGVGIWPAVTENDRRAGAELHASEEMTRSALMSFGYDARAPLRMLVTAFQRHFEPETFRHWEHEPEYTQETAARLAAALRIKGEAEA